MRGAAERVGVAPAHQAPRLSGGLGTRLGWGHIPSTCGQHPCVSHPRPGPPAPAGQPTGPRCSSTQEERAVDTHSLTRERRVAKASGWMDRMAFQLRSLRAEDVTGGYSDTWTRRSYPGSPTHVPWCGHAGRLPPGGPHGVQAYREGPHWGSSRGAGVQGGLPGCWGSPWGAGVQGGPPQALGVLTGRRRAGRAPRALGVLTGHRRAGRAPPGAGGPHGVQACREGPPGCWGSPRGAGVQ